MRRGEDRRGECNHPLSVNPSSAPLEIIPKRGVESNGMTKHISDFKGGQTTVLSDHSGQCHSRAKASIEKHPLMSLLLLLRTVSHLSRSRDHSTQHYSNMTFPKRYTPFPFAGPGNKACAFTSIYLCKYFFLFLESSSYTVSLRSRTVLQ